MSEKEEKQEAQEQDEEQANNNNNMEDSDDEDEGINQVINELYWIRSLNWLKIFKKPSKFEIAIDNILL